MDATRKKPGVRRRINADPAPELAEALTVTRFWQNVRTGDPHECWSWLGDTRADGYGVFFYRGRMRGAHELALSFSTGEVRAAELDTCHSCDNPCCCNPGHLRFDTRLSNVADMDRRGRRVNGSQKLTDAEVRVIRVRRKNGARQKDLAAQFGVTDALISCIIRGTRRRDAGGPIETERKYVRG